MPGINFFYAIAIWMYWNEGVHARPHFHARYAGQVASVDLEGELLAGSPPNRALALVAEWARLHQDESCTQTGSERVEKNPSNRLTRFRKMPDMEKLVDVTAVKVVGNYRLRLTFQDGTVGDVDFSGREWCGVFSPLRDPLYFARVDVDAEAGTIAWPDALDDLAPEPLYAEARRHPVRTAHTAS